MKFKTNFKQNLIPHLSLSLSLCTFSAICCLLLTSCEKEKFAEPTLQKTKPTKSHARINLATDPGIENLYIVEFKRQTNALTGTEEDPLTILEQITSPILESPPVVRQVYYCALYGVAVYLDPSRVQAIANDPKVEHVTKANITYAPSEASAPMPNISSQVVTWGATRVGWTTSTPSGVGKRVYVVDTGVQLDHEDLNVAPMTEARGSRTFVPGTTDAGDEYGHGTAVAGVVAAKNNYFGVVGIAAGATVISCRAIDRSGEGNTADAIAALDYCCSVGAIGEVVNLSIGVKVDEPANTPQTPLERATLNAAQAGLLIAIAAGEESRSADHRSPARIEHPNTFTITSFKQGDSLQSISNFGAAPLVDYSMPGARLRSTLMGNTYGGGFGATSLATPFMSGVLLMNGKQFTTSGRLVYDVDSYKDYIAHLRP